VAEEVRVFKKTVNKAINVFSQKSSKIALKIKKRRFLVKIVQNQPKSIAGGVRAQMRFHETAIIPQGITPKPTNLADNWPYTGIF
jgi:hypothetical protein